MKITITDTATGCEHWTGTLDELIEVNADDPIAPEDIAAIRALEGNEQHRMFPGFTIQAA